MKFKLPKLQFTLGSLIKNQLFFFLIFGLKD